MPVPQLVLNNCYWMNAWMHQWFSCAEELLSGVTLDTALSWVPLMPLLFFLSSRSQSREEVCPLSAPWRISTACPTTIPSNLKTSSWPPSLESWPLHKVSSVLGQKTWGQGGVLWEMSQPDLKKKNSKEDILPTHPPLVDLIQLISFLISLLMIWMVQPKIRRN